MYPISTRFTSSVSIGVLPTRSPMPIAAPCSARRAGLERRQRVDDGEVAVAVAVPVDADAAAALARRPRPTNRATAAAPAGVAWPTVSAMQTRCAPARIAVEYSWRSVSGSARVVSSVTYMTGSPSPTANVIASSVSREQLVERPAFGVLPQRARADERAALDRHRRRAARSRRSAVMSAITRPRRAVGLDRAAARRRSRAPAARRRATTCGPAPGRPMSAVSIPSRSIRWRICSFSSIVGHRTDGDCSPSRSVSSSSRTGSAGRGGRAVPVVDERMHRLHDAATRARAAAAGAS